MSGLPLHIILVQLMLKMLIVFRFALKHCVRILGFVTGKGSIFKRLSRKTRWINRAHFTMENRTVKEASVEGVQRRTQPKKHFVSLSLTRIVDHTSKEIACPSI